jgi:hypothetical protein
MRRNRVARLAFLKPNFRNMAFLKFVWRHKIHLPFWLFRALLSMLKLKKQSHYRPGQALKVVSPTHRRPLPPRKYFWYSFLLESWVNPRFVVRPEGLCQRKIPMTPSGIEPAAFRLVVQSLNHLSHLVSLYAKIIRTKLHTILSLNHFPLRKKFFFFQLHLAIISAARSLGKKAPAAICASRQPVSRPNTADTWYVWGYSLEFVVDVGSVWM